MHQIRTLIDRFPSAVESVLPPRLRTAYDGDLGLPRPARGRMHVAANFVTTLDGVASFQIVGRAGGGEISGFNEADRFIMGLLRSMTDAVLFGSGSLHGDPGHVRTAEFVYPQLREEFRSFRQTRLHKPIHPLNVVLSGTGRVNLDEPTFHTPDLSTLIITTEAGLDRLQSDHGSSLAVAQVRTVGEGGNRVPPAGALRILRDEFGVRHLLHEGGPTLFGQFLGKGLVDELFLTLAPQIAGRDQFQHRPGIIEQMSFSPDGAPWFDLMNVRMAGSHLYMRYKRIRPEGDLAKAESC